MTHIKLLEVVNTLDSINSRSDMTGKKIKLDIAIKTTLLSGTFHF